MTNPVAFMSYVRFDDQHEGGRLTQFCKRLGGEVQMQLGEEFQIFQDRNDITWGQQWKKRIDESLDAVTFLIPILTPGFFKSVACRDELERFLEREKRLKRDDLILPVYYLNCPVLNDEVKRKTDKLAEVIASRQYADWRELRFEPITSPELGKTLAKLASQIVDALQRSSPSSVLSGVASKSKKPRATFSKSPARKGKSVFAKSGQPVQSAIATTPQRAESAGKAAEATGPALKTEPPTQVVDALHRGDHATLTEALEAAKPGDRILVRPGLYREGVIIDKAVEIIGDGETGEIVIEATGKHTVLFKANMGRITNLTLRQAGEGQWYCVDIAQGRLDLEGCDISSQSFACVAIHGGADPRLRRNRIHDGKRSGVLVYDNGQGTLEDNDIFANEFAGVSIMRGGNPTLRRNRIHDGKQGGVAVYDNGQGVLEDNDIFGNGLAGVEIRTEANPVLRRNRIHDGRFPGIFVLQKGLGIVEDNDIFGNDHFGVEVKEGGSPTFRRNRISNNTYQAIHIHTSGEGVFEDNDLRGNNKGAWNISEDSKNKVKRKGNLE